MNLLKELWEFFAGNLKSIFFAVIMLTMAIVFLPESWVYYILRKLKPDLVPKSKFMLRVREVLNAMVGENLIRANGETNILKARLSKIEYLVEERRKLSENLFFYDLLRNLSSMLCYILPKEGYNEDSSLSLIDSAMSYITQYAHKIQDTHTFRNETQELEVVAGQMRNSVADLQKFLLEKPNAFEGLGGNISILKMSALQFDKYMQDRWRSQNDAWKRVSRDLADLLEEHVERTENDEI